jgi:S-adenosylmethionine-dependent methyltransferase
MPGASTTVGCVATDFRLDALVGDVLLRVVDTLLANTGLAGTGLAGSPRPVLDIVDVGGGTGGLAVPLATRGHNVTVVDPSPDALAAAQRRAAEVSARLTAVQGEAASLDGVVGLAAADLIICHNVLEYVDSPPDAMAAIAKVLRPGGTVSVLASNAVAAVLHRALAGRFAEARHMLTEGVRNRFTLPELTVLLEGAGLRPGEAHGLRIFGGLVPGALVDGDPGAASELLALETAAATYPPLRDIAAQLHLLGHR